MYPHDIYERRYDGAMGVLGRLLGRVDMVSAQPLPPFRVDDDDAAALQAQICALFPLAEIQARRREVVKLSLDSTPPPLVCFGVRVGRGRTRTPCSLVCLRLCVRVCVSDTSLDISTS